MVAADYATFAIFSGAVFRMNIYIFLANLVKPLATIAFSFLRVRVYAAAAAAHSCAL